MKMKSIRQNTHMKNKKCPLWLLITMVIFICSVVAGETSDLKQSSTNDLSIVRRAVLFLRSQGVLVDHEYFGKTPIFPKEISSSDDVLFKAGTPPDTLLNTVCRHSSECTWLHDARSGRYLVRPATNALSNTEVSSMSITNYTISTLFSDQRIRRHMVDKGIIWIAPWPRQKTGMDVYIDFEFTGGSLADFLAEIARSAGRGVCWDMEQCMSSIVRVPIGNRVVNRPQVKIELTPAKGGGIAHLKPVLRTATTVELENMLSGANPRKRLAIASELASRCADIGDIEKTRGFFRVALDASEYDHERWELKLRMLEGGLGYPTKAQAASPRTGQLETFIADCDDRMTRHTALSRLLNIYLKDRAEGKARALIEKTNVNAADLEWVHNAVKIFQQQNPAAPPPSISSNTVPAKTATRPVIRTTYTIKKTADGKLEKHVTTTETPVAVDTNK